MSKKHTFVENLNELKILWGMGEFIFNSDSQDKGKKFMDDLEDNFIQLQEEFHNELYGYYTEELVHMNSPLTLEPPQKRRGGRNANREIDKDNLRLKDFRKLVDKIKVAIDNNQKIEVIQDDLNQLTNIYDSLFHHLRASKKFSHCHSSATSIKG
jgi:hypothetical protein